MNLTMYGYQHLALRVSISAFLAHFTADSARAQFPTFDFVTGGVLDQEYVEDFSDPRYTNASSYAPISPYQFVAQSFVAGQNATLSHIEIRMGVSWFTPVKLSVLDFRDSLPNEVLASRTLMPGHITTDRWITFNLQSDSLRLTAGEEYAIALELLSNDGSASWLSSLWGDPVLTYEPGGIYFRHPMADPGEPLPNDGLWYALTDPTQNNDLLFRVYVAPIPEPSTFLLALVCFSLIAVRRR